MHEMSLAEGIVQLIEEAAHSEGFAKVTAVWLEIGRLAAVEPDALRFCFDAVVAGTIAEGSRLEIIDVEGSGWCMDCCEPVTLGALFGPCPQCGSHKVQATGGTEMRVKELAVT
ncbi:hydrogenase maturation nickel metallochaperone HypA [Methylotetracoccus oryzae]|uniref:hydrogenase maturation nickel metallochaperone HypA n=1 Tax=Methylotetracoccus oryzae TaxID=1919059 RepID=UPI00111BBACA|nr:hydrogenase maturation nickel metallochaperone HypA [Methylotetracoccus oryzae]